jgi:hypothetical protein
MSSGTSLVDSFYVMLISFLLTYVLNIGLGFMLDRILVTFAAAGVYDVSAVWDPTSHLSMNCNDELQRVLSASLYDSDTRHCTVRLYGCAEAAV